MSIRVTVSRPRRGLFGPYRFSTIAEAWAAEVGPLVQRALKAEAPVSKEGARPGRLRESIRYEKKNASGSLVLTFTASVPYARYVIEGTAAHQIRPRIATALHWKDGSGDHFARVVNHPGTKPNRFPERAITPLLPVVQQRFKQISVEAMGGQ